MAETAAAYIFKVVASTALKAGASKAAAAFLAKSAVFAAKVGLTVGASAALNAAFAPRVSTPDSRIAQRQPTPERAAAFGRVRSAGAYSLYSTSGGDSIDVLAFHDGRIAGIDQIYLHDDLVTLGTGPLGAGFVQGDSRTGQYFEAIYIDTRLGTANQSAFTRARSKVPGEWSSQHCMDGVAALELLCLGPKKERLPKVYPLGLPRPSVVYRAQYCFDFRQSGQSVENWRGWTPGSRNPVLQMVTYMCNPAVPDPVEPDRALGLGMDFDTEIAPHLDAWIAAANACDQLVPKKGGGTEPRYQCDFEYYVGEDPADTIARFLASCDGWMSETGDGALTIKVGAYDGSAVEINSDWVIGHAINRGVPDEQLKNVFVGFYTDPDKKFSQVEGAPWYDQGSIALTGKRRYERVPMTQVQSHGQLTRLLKRIALRRNAEARGTLRLSLPALDLMGERWLKFPMDFPNSEFLRGKIVEVEALEIDFSDGGAVILDWAIYDTDADTFDPDTEEGAAPPAPSESELSTPPVIDVGDVSAALDTESRFGGQRQAVAVLTFPAPVRSYDIAGAGSVDVPRTDLGWRVRWRVRPSGGWTESAISGDVIEGDEVSGWTVRLRTPDLPRAALDLQIAAVGPRDDQGDWSDSVPVDVDAATAPALAAPANVTATAALEESEGGVKRPALTVSFDPITSPEAQMVLIAIKPAGDPDSAFAQIDAIEPRLGGKTIYTIPYGRTVDVGLQTWAQWREPSDWAVVEGVEIPGEVVASDATIPSERIDAARDAINDALGAANEAFEDAAGQLAAVADTGARLSLKTWLRDPLLTGLEGWKAPGGVLQIVAGDPNALQAYWPFDGTGEQSDRVLIWPVNQPIAASRYVQAACEVGVLGSVSEVILKALWLDAAGDLISSAEIDRGSEGRLEGIATAPAGAAAVQIRCVPVVEEAAGGAFYIRRPQAAYALPGQQDVDPFAAPGDELMARIETLERLLGGTAEFQRNQLVENRDARAWTRERFLATVDLQNAVALIDLTANATFKGVKDTVDGLPNDVLSAASARGIYLAKADLQSAVALIDLTANSAFQSVKQKVDGLPNETLLTVSGANLTFLAKSDLESALSNIDLFTYSSITENTSKVIWSATTPAVGDYKEGDVWVRVSDKAWHVHDGSQWVLARDEGLVTTAFAGANYLTETSLQSALASVNFSALTFFGGIPAGATSWLEAFQDIEGRLLATYGFRLDVNGKIADMQALNDGTTSEIAFNFDAFKIYTGSADVQPFTFANGVLEGQNFVFDGGYIKDLTVDTLQIKDNAISQTASAAATSGTPQTSVTSSGGSVLVIASLYFQTLATAGQEHAIQRQIGAGSWTTIKSITGNPGNSLCLATVDQPGAAGQALRYRITSPTSTFLKELAFLQIVK
ncbi:MAG: hypothetical protein CMH91_01415 [Oceanicaulis sp.]|uniref:hypothetical protein n=1 Tax=unclassified Oceanicaulis TaxID=2632123 RepID=UPI000C660DCF|nr:MULTISPECIES: hypothetical protein [unclassified Oceanicaulis]MBC37706.1 hypothetical protein [Oceanicaulis sp.]HBU62456.1 hypothetical protein [Oceanicaulis sp.]